MAKLELRIRGRITASILRFVPSPSHGLISLLPWEPTASVADLETAAVNSPRILRSSRGGEVCSGRLRPTPSPVGCDLTDASRNEFRRLSHRSVFRLSI